MKTKDLLDLFKKILQINNLPETQINIVSNVMEWEIANNLSDNNTFRLAIAAHRENSKIFDIVIKEQIDKDDIPPVTSAMDLRGFSHCKELNDVKKFIIHTFLHEVGHIKGYSELKADNWAYEELLKLKL